MSELHEHEKVVFYVQVHVAKKVSVAKLKVIHQNFFIDTI